ncbi:MAG: signal peptidase I [Bacteroidetes bacterium]|nr:signal peptidase I [Bacteroidota bacterium]
MASQKQQKHQQHEKHQQEKEHIPFGKKVLSFLKELAIVLVLFLVINNFVIASFLVPTGSMENEVLTGEMLFVNKFIYGGTSPRNIPFTNVRLQYFRLPAVRDVRRGDVIVFVFPGNRDEVEPAEFTFYLKRCIGLPGDTIVIRNRAVYVNSTFVPFPRNVRFDRPWAIPPTYAEENIFPKNSGWNSDNYGPIVVPKKGMTIQLTPENYDGWEVFIRREGHQVRRVDQDVYVDDKRVTSYTVERDYLFGMGDHRDNSLDSRYWGFIPKENLVGTPMIVYWSWNTDIPLYDIFGRLATVRWGRIGALIK